MPDDEFKDLDVFGKRFNQNKENIKQEKRSITKNNNLVERKTFLKKIIKSLGREILFFCRLFFKKKFSYIKSNIIMYTSNKQRSSGFKIVETKKQRKNKVIITRKRIPIKSTIRFKKNIASSCLYFFNLDNKNELDEPKIKGHTILKESIWDFPHKK